MGKTQKNLFFQIFKFLDFRRKKYIKISNNWAKKCKLFCQNLENTISTCKNWQYFKIVLVLTDIQEEHNFVPKNIYQKSTFFIFFLTKIHKFQTNVEFCYEFFWKKMLVLFSQIRVKFKKLRFFLFWKKKYVFINVGKH